MSSFLFLHFCDDVFELLGLYFSAFILSRVSSGGFLPLPPKPPQWSHTASTGLVCGFAGVAPYPALKTAHKAAQGRVWFLPRTNLPLPLKGEGLGIILVGFLTTGLRWPNRAGLGLRWCRSPTRPPKLHKGPHRGEFGFCSLAGTSQREYHAPFQNSHVKIQAEEKNHLCPAFENPSRLSSPLCASVSSNPVG